MKYRDTSTDLEDDIPQTRAHGDFHQAGIGYLADQGENLRALAPFGSELREPVRALIDEVRSDASRQTGMFSVRFFLDKSQETFYSYIIVIL
jgi:hypothetical protein